MGMQPEMEILASTLLEYWAVRHVLPHARASWAGVRLSRLKDSHWQDRSWDSVVVVCGLAGALAPGLPPGTVLIPERVGLADGSIIHCDPALVQALVAAARMLHFRLHTGPLLTAPSLIVADDRHYWSQQGFVAVDMETGLLAGRNLRIATIRVVLDSPEYGISPNWLTPAKALLQPSLWRELFWLARVAPRYALRAAHVLKVGLATGQATFVE
jgi:hypothetical protein